MGRTPCCEGKPGLKKGAWTAEEDEKLLSFIQKNKRHGSWRTLPQLAGLQRCGKSCRLRWTNYLRPNIKRGNFSPEEERIIIRLHALLGNKWSSIASHLPGRTDNEVKNHWNTHLKKRLLKAGIDPTTHLPLPFAAAAAVLDLNNTNYSWSNRLMPCHVDPSLACNLAQWQLAGQQLRSVILDNYAARYNHSSLLDQLMTNQTAPADQQFSALYANDQICSLLNQRQQLEAMILSCMQNDQFTCVNPSLNQQQYLAERCLHTNSPGQVDSNLSELDQSYNSQLVATPDITSSTSSAPAFNQTYNMPDQYHDQRFPAHNNSADLSLNSTEQVIKATSHGLSQVADNDDPTTYWNKILDSLDF